MPQAEIRLSASQLSVEQTAAAINGMIAERASERLEKVPVVEPPAEAPNLTGTLKPHAPGIVFGMSAEDYHRDPSLGSTDIKRLLRSPSDYWWESHLNPDRPPDNDTPAKQKGRALHKLVLEGEAAFARAFVEQPQPCGHPGSLVTLEDLKAKCRDLGEPVSGTKAELAKRIKAKDPNAIIFEDVLALFWSMVERDGLEVLKPDAMREVRQAAASITLNPHLARAFQGGIPEVSVFWVDEYGTPDQQALLEGKLDKANVKSRRGANGKAVSYLEAWHVIDMANEVFGFGNWDAETVEMKREHDPVQIPPTEEHPRGGIVVTYSAKVRVTVYSQDGSRKVVRERSGGHRGFGPTVGQAVEDCIKAAESDATKRAFVTFGNVFGLALYDKEQRNVGAATRRIEQGHERPMAPIDEGFDQSQPERQSTSQRALAVSSRPPAPTANGRDRSVLPY